MCSILSLGILSKICFIYLNHADWDEDKTVPKFKVNTIYTNKADFRKDTTHWVTLSAILFRRLNCHPATGRKYLVMRVMNYSTHEY